jgi:antitoxin (DNA-binding transcriptional repressor) of toxin-antitoxin stability system
MVTMKHIVLTPEQARVVLGGEEPVEVRDEQGRTVAHLTPLSPLDVEAIERHRRGQGRQQPSIPSEQVQAHFRRLEEIRRSEGMDEAKALDLLRRLRAGEEV